MTLLYVYVCKELISIYSLVVVVVVVVEALHQNDEHMRGTMEDLLASASWGPWGNFIAKINVLTH